MTRREATIFVITRSVGNFLVLFSLYGVVATFGPVIAAEVKYRTAEARGVQYAVSLNGDRRTEIGELPEKISGSDVSIATHSPSFTDILTGEKEQVLTPPDTSFSVVIPKIGASAKVFPNVDATDEKTFLPLLQQGVAHAKGSVFPGMSGNIYLFAHSTDNWWHVGQYNAVFYLVKDLSNGDSIIVFFEGRRYDYVVTQKLVLDATDVSLLTRDHSGSETLVLQTCWPPGTTWKRLYIVATPKRTL